MGWLRESDGSLAWQDERSGMVMRRIPPEQAALVEERWAEEERQRQGLIRNRPAMGAITEEDLTRVMSQPTAYQRQMREDLDRMNAIEAREHEGVLRAEAEAGRVIAGHIQSSDGTSRGDIR